MGRLIHLLSSVVDIMNVNRKSMNLCNIKILGLFLFISDVQFSVLYLTGINDMLCTGPLTY